MANTWLFLLFVLASASYFEPEITRFDLHKSYRKLVGLNSTGHYVPLFGKYSELGYYFAYLQVGTPFQTFSVIMDTGSSLTAVPCAGCEKCGKHMDPKFDMSASTSAKYVSCSSECFTGTCDKKICSYQQSYSEGSTIQGYVVEDVAWLGSEGSKEAVPFKFGCQMAESGLFRSQLADGIMGLSPSKKTFVDVLMDHHKLQTNVFSICLGVVGGSMTVGGINKSHHWEPIVYTPMDTNSFYSLKLHDISIGSASISASLNDFGRVILDSGTTFTYIAEKAHRRLIDGMKTMCLASGQCSYHQQNEYFSDCFNLKSTNPNWNFPILQFQFDQASISMTPAEYLGFEKVNFACLLILKSQSTILGQNFMHNYDVIFDRANNRAGFARSNCTDSGICYDCYNGARSINSNFIEESWMHSLIIVLMVFFGISCLYLCAKQRQDQNRYSIVIDSNQEMWQQMDREIPQLSQEEFPRHMETQFQIEDDIEENFDLEVQEDENECDFELSDEELERNIIDIKH